LFSIIKNKLTPNMPPKMQQNAPFSTHK